MRTEHYDDRTTILFPHSDMEWDSEPGDRGAFREEWSQLTDSQNYLSCVDPYLDTITPIQEYTYYMLASGFAGSNAGSAVIGDRGSALSQCISGEVKDSAPPSGNPCVPGLQASYGGDGGIVSLDATTCPDQIGWNLYQELGGGSRKLLSSMGPGVVYQDSSFELNEQRTYSATTFSENCEESGTSQSVTVLHNDTVAPDPPEELSFTLAGNSLTVNWAWPYTGDVDGYKLYIGSESGGPYIQAHSGVLNRLLESYTVQSISGGTTHYVVMKSLDASGNESAYSNELVVVVP